MYQFRRFTAGPFAVHETLASIGDEHRKRLGEGVTPANQATLNCYISGRWAIEYADGGRAEFGAGQCSLDALLDALPAGLCVERCIEAGQRLCIEPIVAVAPWTRDVMTVAAGEAVRAAGATVVVLSGRLQDGDRDMPAGAARRVAGDAQALEASRIVVLRTRPVG